ncbi:uncharacterized protein LTR77_006674 [Saxophila tyrrhenica]|uniref:Zn(2)-C6 fungal-type domain-containing protein n=1 Tax=Saxophila tyrrhenica TaxID=1690608 RepID=A0AAV9P9N0_9PEZI|nr:hypothetical protein LTR77_006674 [Saxophila tyrrhenica]
MSSSQHILLAPAGAGDSSGGASGQNPQQQPPNPGSKPKRTLIESACSACRRRKSKCDGHRPVCSRCSALKTHCTYEAQEGESRWSALRRRKKDVESDKDDLTELLTYLRDAEEPEATDVFHQIRSSGFDNILRVIRHARQDGHSIATSPLSQAASPGMSHQQRLPSIRSMLDTTGSTEGNTGPAPPTAPRRVPSMSSDGSAGSAGSADSNVSGASASSGLGLGPGLPSG